MLNTVTERQTFRVNLEAPDFLLKDTDLFNPCILNIDEEIDGLIELETERAPKVLDALCSHSSSGYEMYDIVEPGSIIDNYLVGAERLYRISGVGINLGPDHLYILNNKLGYFEFSEETNEEIVFNTTSNNILIEAYGSSILTKDIDQEDLIQLIDNLKYEEKLNSSMTLYDSEKDEARLRLEEHLDLASKYDLGDKGTTNLLNNL